MGTWWRSQDMSYVSLILSEEAAISSIRELGVLGCIQFVDLNPDLTPFQRRFVSFIKRCEEIERKIRYVHGELKKLNIEVHPAGNVDTFLQNSLGTEAVGKYKKLLFYLFTIF
jgi:V-type H+-transporting ATPase subunit a